eukprot:11538068-Heterocapsa_arctica.AAC.1
MELGGTGLGAAWSSGPSRTGTRRRPGARGGGSSRTSAGTRNRRGDLLRRAQEQVPAHQVREGQTRGNRAAHKYSDERPHRQRVSTEVEETTILWRHTNLKGGRKAGTGHMNTLGTRGEHHGQKVKQEIEWTTSVWTKHHFNGKARGYQPSM